MQASAAMQQSCTRIVSCFPVNKAQEKEKNVEEEKVEEVVNKEEEEEEEGDKITTTIQSSA